MSFLIPEAKQLLNSLKCPICKSPIDLYSGVPLYNRSGHNFACAEDNQHYSLLLKYDISPILIMQERTHVYDHNKKYQLNKTYDYEGGGSITTEIVIYRIDPEGREMFSFEKKRLSFDKDLFDFSNFNKEKAIQRIETILVFH